MEDDFMSGDNSFDSAKCESMLPDLTIKPGMSEKDIKRINDMKAQLQTEMELIGDMMGHSTIKPTDTKVKSNTAVQIKTKPIQTKPIQTKPVQTQTKSAKSKTKPVKKFDEDEYDYDEYAEYDGLYND